MADSDTYNPAAFRFLKPASSKMQIKPLISVLPAVILGILIDRSASLVVGSEFWLTAAAIAWLGWWTARRARWKTAWVWLLIACCFASAARHHEHWFRYQDQDVAILDIDPGDSVPVAVRCELLTIPEPSPLPPQNPLTTLPQGVESKFAVRLVEIRNGTNWERATGRVSVRLEGHALGYAVGDTVEVFGSLSRLPAPMNPGERDWRAQERNRRTVCRLNISHPDCMTRTKSSHSVFGLLGSVRVAGLEALDRFVGPARSPLAGALLLGARDRLDRDRVEQFFQTGTIHLLAISGLHIGILAWGFFFLAKRTAARQYLLLGLMLGAVLYCHLTGVRPSVLRAVVLVQVICISWLWRRDVCAFNALSAAAILVLVHRPGSLFLPGAQLSFLAVAVLIWLSENYEERVVEPLDRLVSQTRPAYQRALAAIGGKAKQLSLAGCAIWLLTLPLVMHWFHLCSPIGLLLNVFLAVPITLGLLSGFAVLLSNKIAWPVAAMGGWFCDLNLAVVESIVQFSHGLPAAFFWLAGPNSAWCSVFYLVLGVLFLLPKLRFNKLIAVTWLAMWLTISMLSQWMGVVATSDELRCTFLSVGHGTCVVMEMPDDRVVVYDAGRMGSPAVGVGIVSDFLWSRGISHIDAVVISHADADHYNLVPSLTERFSVGEVFVSSRMFESPSGGVVALQNAIEQAEIPIRHLMTNDVLRFEDASLHVLHPLPEGVKGSDNANSIVLEVSYEGRVLLLPGDLEAQGLEDVMAEMPRDSDLVMAAHHGSLRSAPQEFSQWCSPEHVVISGGRDDNHQKVIDAFASEERAVLHTAYDGAVTVTIAEDKFDVVSFVGR